MWCLDRGQRFLAGIQGRARSCSSAWVNSGPREDKVHVGFCFPGHFCTCLERMVRGREGGTLTTSCEYSPGWESYRKWWCRGKNWNSCKILVKTTGSEKLQLVKKGRVSIQDNHSRHMFTVTLEDLWYDDEDTYWCGIEQTGTDIGFKFSVIVDPGRHYPPVFWAPGTHPQRSQDCFSVFPRWMERSLESGLRPYVCMCLCEWVCACESMGGGTKILERTGIKSEPPQCRMSPSGLPRGLERTHLARTGLSRGGSSFFPGHIHPQHIPACVG
uniref:Immunoglobulin V-set domain-containing protein n=1 Tax=Lynx canadensis TaxID=61383 RepID=A0A667IK55_LYNCA